jgi:hypothetical protein
VVSLYWAKNINYKYMGTVYAGKYLVIQQVKYMWMILHNVNLLNIQLVKYCPHSANNIIISWTHSSNHRSFAQTKEIKNICKSLVGNALWIAAIIKQRILQNGFCSYRNPEFSHIMAFHRDISCTKS